MSALNPKWKTILWRNYSSTTFADQNDFDGDPHPAFDLQDSNVVSSVESDPDSSIFL